MPMRPLGATGIMVSPVGLGTVKLGRDRGVKYPERVRIPTDAEAGALLAKAHDLGVNLIDTAPAYGASEERLGRLLPGPRTDWVIVTKAGETFEEGRSTFDFSAEATRASVARSLARLRTGYLDVVLVHSNGEDERIIKEMGTLEALAELKRRGLIRAVGFSSKTMEGGMAAVERCDVVMVTCRRGEAGDAAVIEAARKRGVGVLVKKALGGGHLVSGGGGEGDRERGAGRAADRRREAVAEAMRFIFGVAGVSSVVVGTVSEAHLREDVGAAERALARR